MFYIKNGDHFKPLINGITFKNMVIGSTTSMFCFNIPKGAIIPSHNHPHEQTGFMVSGKMIFRIGDEVRTVSAGDSWAIPGHVFHDVEALENCEVIEVFSPVREEYL